MKRLEEIIVTGSPRVLRALETFATNRPKINERIMAKTMIDRILSEVEMAARKCLPADFHAGWELESTEVEIGAYNLARKEQGTIDIIHTNPANQMGLIVDWKRVGWLDNKKEIYYSRTPQPWMYLEIAQTAHPGFKFDFEFRFFVAENSRGPAHMVTRSISFEEGEVEFLRNELEVRKEAMDLYNRLGHWPRDGASCHKWGGICEFARKCWEKPQPAEMRFGAPIISQSLVSTFNECPRKYFYTVERAESSGEDFHELGESNHAAMFGSMFHEGIAEMYRTAKEVLSDG